ncbi:MAG: cysteine desulfurase [Deltaproteobacteria bacterium]|nr:cysteine desulfurase [Deltaproteobacteria bacterium]MCB9786463.1 cysteine desulfurase [Deltaproteobacteria bacterium]
MGRSYLDYNATAPLRPEVSRAMAGAAWGNPSSLHAEGRAARACLEGARETLARALGARPAELVFTGSATEANNLALRGLFGGPAGERPRLALSQVEHPSVVQTARALVASGQAEGADAIAVDGEGRLRPEALRRAVGRQTRVVSVLAASNETGVLQDIGAVVEAARAAGALVHVDAVQRFGRLPLDVASLGADLVTVSSHKLGGPRGAGALWVRPGVALRPQIAGGHQERNRRGGTEDVPAIVGFAEAARVATADLETEARRLAALRDRLWEGIAEAVPGVRVLGLAAPRLPNTLSLVFPGADGEALLFGLDLAGVAASSGSACTAGSLEPSPALLAMGLDEGTARSALRVSLGWASTAADVEHLTRVLPDIVARARQEAA